MGLLFSVQFFSYCSISHPRSRKHPNVISHFKAGNKTLSRLLGIDSNLTLIGAVACGTGIWKSAPAAQMALDTTVCLQRQCETRLWGQKGRFGGQSISSLALG